MSRGGRPPLLSVLLTDSRPECHGLRFGQAQVDPIRMFAPRHVLTAFRSRLTLLSDRLCVFLWHTMLLLSEFGLCCVEFTSKANGEWRNGFHGERRIHSVISDTCCLNYSKLAMHRRFNLRPYAAFYSVSVERVGGGGPSGP